MTQSTELLRPNEKHPSVVYYRKQRAWVNQPPPYCPPWSMQEELGASQSFAEDLDLQRKFSSAAEFALCLLQPELVRVVRAGREAAGAPPLRAPWVVGPPTEVLHHWAQENMGQTKPRVFY